MRLFRLIANAPVTPAAVLIGLTWAMTTGYVIALALVDWLVGVRW